MNGWIPSIVVPPSLHPVYLAQSRSTRRSQARGLPVRDESCGVTHSEIADHGLGGITDDKEWPPALIDDVPPVARYLEREDVGPSDGLGTKLKGHGIADAKGTVSRSRGARRAHRHYHAHTDQREKSLPQHPHPRDETVSQSCPNVGTDP